MTNPALLNMVKIGFATDVEERRKQLSTTALPYEYEIYATYETSGKLEDKKLHRMIDQLNPDLRVSVSREFYIMSPEDAFNLFESIAFISNTFDKLKRFTNIESSNDEDCNSNQKIKKPQINFSKCNIPIGAELICIKNPEIRVTVADERKVNYNGELISLSTLMKSLFGIWCQGTHYFTYNGRLITDIASETQWKN